MRHKTSKIAPLLLLLMLGVWAGPAFAGTPVLHLDNGFEPVSLAVIGHDLAVSVEGADPSRTYVLELVDEAGAVVASTSLTTNRFGGHGPRMLLRRRHLVVGCDPGVVPDPGAYRFQSDLDAEIALDGRLFSARLVEPTTGVPVGGVDVGWVASTEPRFFVSDAGGCPRYAFHPEEPAYVTGIRLPLGQPLQHHLWLLDADGFDGKLRDRRRGYPEGQTLSLSGTSETHTEMILQFPDVSGCIPLTVQPPLQSGDGPIIAADKILSPVKVHTCSEGATAEPAGCPPCEW